MRWWPSLLLLALPTGAQEVNPVQPAAARLLLDRATCLRFASEVGAKVATTTTGKADVYSGDAGVALLLIDLYRATKEQRWRAAARAALDRAYAGRTALGAGLYTGRAGVGQACLAAYRATGDEEHLARARACAKNLTYRATDVISGAAGAGIFLLNLHAATGEHLDEVTRAADYLVRLADRKDGNARWPVAPGGRVYVGFSHGAAGIGYFLRHAARATGRDAYKTLAEEAARYVEGMAEPEGPDGWHWWRTDPPDRNEMARIQWCHGAPGTGLFFADLVRLDGAHEEALARCLATTRRRGRTVRRSGCQCHGVAGNAELFLFAYPVRKDKGLLDEARRFGSALLEPTPSGFRVAGSYDPGYMTGWAGIGHFFLRLADPGGVGMPLMVEESR